MKKISVLIIAMLGIVLSGFAQNEKAEFKPNGKPFIKVFSNYHTSFSDGEVAPAFEITRAYFGYEFNLSNQLSGKLNVDVGDPGVGKFKMTAYLKNAYLKYKANNLTVNFGMISTLHFKVEEGIWGYRYIMEPFAGNNKLGSSADIGVSIAYKLSDVISADASVVNGEGYKKLQSDSIFKYSLGMSINPVEGVTLRGYYDFMGSDATQSTLSAFVGYNGKTVTLGGSYNKQMNNGMTEGKDLSGVSVFATIKPSKEVKIFARYDNLSSNKMKGEVTEWNLSKDGALYIAGLEFSPVKGVKLAPNFQGWSPANSAKPFMTSLFLNCELKF